MSQGQILYALNAGRGFLKLAGVIRHPLGPRLKHAVRRLFEAPDMHGVVVDLQEATFIDSTCLGLLARLVTRSAEHECPQPVIVSTNPEITRILTAMGFDQVFGLIEQAALPAEGLADAADLAGESRRPDRQLLLEAHRALADLNLKNRHLFRDVIAQLEQELDSDD